VLPQERFDTIDTLMQHLNDVLSGHSLRHTACALTLLLSDVYEQVAQGTGRPGAFDKLDERAVRLADQLITRYGRDQMVNVSLQVLFDLAMRNLHNEVGQAGEANGTG
jgi:hypothetical protein